MTEADGFRVEAALQFGFTEIDGLDPGTTAFSCTDAELIAFAKACERAGMWKAKEIAVGFCSKRTAEVLAERIAEIDVDLAPVLEAERQRQLAVAA